MSYDDPNDKTGDDKGKELVEGIIIFIVCAAIGALVIPFLIFLWPLAIVAGIIFFAFFQSGLASYLGGIYRKVTGEEARLIAEAEARKNQDPPAPSPDDLIE